MKINLKPRIYEIKGVIEVDKTDIVTDSKQLFWMCLLRYFELQPLLEEGFYELGIRQDYISGRRLRPRSKVTRYLAYITRVHGAESEMNHIVTSPYPAEMFENRASNWYNSFKAMDEIKEVVSRACDEAHQGDDAYCINQVMEDICKILNVPK